MVALGVIGLIAVAISIFVMYIKSQRPEVQMSKIGVLIRPLKDHIRDEIQKLEIVLKVMEEYQSQNQYTNRVLGLFNKIDNSNESYDLNEKIKALKSEDFYKVRQSLVANLPAPYCDEFPKNVDELSAYNENLNSKIVEFLKVESSLIHDHLEVEQIRDYYEKYFPENLSFVKNNTNKSAWKKIGITCIYLPIIAGFMALCIFFSSDLATNMAKECYEDSLNERFAEATLSDATIESVGYSQFYTSDKYVVYMCDNAIINSNMIKQYKDDSEKLLEVVRELYWKSKYHMTYYHDNGYEVKFDYGTWYGINITIKDDEGNEYWYGKTDMYSDYYLKLNGEHIK